MAIRTYHDLDVFRDPILLLSMSPEWLRSFRFLNSASLQVRFGGRLAQFPPIL